MSFFELLKMFFYHKDLLPPSDQLPGTLFSALHVIVTFLVFLGVLAYAVVLIRGDASRMKISLTALWLVVLVLEAIKIYWEIYGGSWIHRSYQSIFPLHSVSLFLFVFPFCLWGKGIVKHASCSYVCTIGILGALINFIYPVNILNDYSIISFPGVLSLLNHGLMICSALVLIGRREIKFTGVYSLTKIFAGCLPILIFSIPVNIVNFALDADYMFFRCNTSILRPIGNALPDFACVALVYLIYILINTVPFFPSYISNRINVNKRLHSLE